jgi:ABC-type iron transport system FetAB ATPase subunit
LLQATEPQLSRRDLAGLRIDRLASKLIGPISFDITRGECLALMGPSGAGKSLLLRAIVDLDPNTGNVALGEKARAAMSASEWRKRVALVPGDSGWWSDRVRDHFPDKPEVAGLIEKLGLGGALEWEVGRLSTGERQRLALARALCLRPQVLLLDEPTASLDEHATELVEDLIHERCRHGMALLVVTHDRRQAERIAKRLLRMIDGRIDQTSERAP